MDSLVAAADGSHLSGAMIALMPTVADAERLAIEGGEAADQLHLTLYYLGDDGTQWHEDAREAAAARSEQLIQQSQAMHAVRFTTGRPPDLLHPALCSQHAYSCPFTHAAVKLAQLPRPGTSGTYEARLSPFGQLVIGQRSPYLDTSAFLTTASSPRSSNGYAHSRR